MVIREAFGPLVTETCERVGLRLTGQPPYLPLPSLTYRTHSPDSSKHSPPTTSTLSPGVASSIHHALLVHPPRPRRPALLSLPPPIYLRLRVRLYPARLGEKDILVHLGLDVRDLRDGRRDILWLQLQFWLSLSQRCFRLLRRQQNQLLH